jgi:hypothetical protein
VRMPRAAQARTALTTLGSVMTAWATERAAIENMIERFGSGVFACVMDRHVEANTLLFARSHPVTALTMSTRSPRCCPLWRPRS